MIKKHVWFAANSRNVRLGLTSNGFNPFGNIMSTSYSMLPVVLMPYNLPQWRCMKDLYMILSLLILGRKAPRKKIDVYLRPLVDDLKELWNKGIKMYDTSMQHSFKLYATLLWTINDFLAYTNLTRWSTKRKLVCPFVTRINTVERI